MDKILEFFKGFDFKGLIEKIGEFLNKYLGIDLL